MRPAHQVIEARCPNCGSPVQVADERAQLVVCPACDSHLTLEGPARDVLRLLDAEGNPRKGDYGLALGQSATFDDVRYEVIARQHWVEEGDLRYSTRVYTLYNPRRALLHLEEYQAVWTLMKKVHVMPIGRPRGRFKTHDGRRWSVDEVIEPQLIHVDGCLPWVARVGDRTTEIECSSGKLRYAVETAGDEVEYHAGRALSPRELRKAMPDAEVPARSAGAPLSERKSRARWLMTTGILGAMLHGCVAVGAAASGNPVIIQEFRATDLSQEVTSQPFPLHEGLARLEFTAPLDNAWMSVNIALMRDEDTVIHVTDADISYYSGYEGGESWSEGSQTSDVLIRIPETGLYRVHLSAVSNVGESETASSAMHPMYLEVIDGARSALIAILGLIFSGIMAVVGGIWLKGLTDE